MTSNEASEVERKRVEKEDEEEATRDQGAGQKAKGDTVEQWISNALR